MPQQAISARIAQIYKTTYGRGPTKIAAFILPELVVVVVDELNVPAHAALVAGGDHDLVETAHRRLHRAMAPEMAAAIETILSRPVTGCVSGFDAALDTATNTFLLAPNDP